MASPTTFGNASSLYAYGTTAQGTVSGNVRPIATNIATHGNSNRVITGIDRLGYAAYSSVTTIGLVRPISIATNRNETHGRYIRHAYSSLATDVDSNATNNGVRALYSPDIYTKNI